MMNNDIHNLVFSFTAAIFGNTITEKTGEDYPKNLINQYGKSKMGVECMLRDIWVGYGLNTNYFWYFNAAGADTSGAIG